MVGLGAGAVALYLAHRVARSLEPQLLELRGSPSQRERPEVPGTPSAPRVVLPARVLSDPLPLEPGARYVASIRLTGVASLLASESRVQAKAEDAGFTNVVVSSSPPAAPPLSPGDYYVTGTFRGAPAAFSRSQGGGRVSIVDGWRIA